MAVSLPFNITADLGANASHIQSNFQALANKFNGAINANDLDPGIVLPSANLSANQVEEIVEFTLNPRLATGAVLGAASTTVPYQFVRLGGTGAYTVVSASFAYTVVTGGGAANGSISIRLGNIVGNLWSTSSTIVAPIALTGTLVAGQSASGDFALATTTFTAPTGIALMPEGAGATNVISLTVTLRLTRSLQ